MEHWLQAHWQSLVMFLTAGGGLGASIKWFPNFWRGAIRMLASPVLFSIEREIRMARTEQVADLLAVIEEKDQEIDRLRQEKKALPSD